MGCCDEERFGEYPAVPMGVSAGENSRADMAQDTGNCSTDGDRVSTSGSQVHRTGELEILLHKILVGARNWKVVPDEV